MERDHSLQNSAQAGLCLLAKVDSSAVLSSRVIESEISSDNVNSLLIWAKIFSEILTAKFDRQSHIPDQLRSNAEEWRRHLPAVSHPSFQVGSQSTLVTHDGGVEHWQ
jgi:hypothetical protein